MSFPPPLCVLQMAMQPPEQILPLVCPGGCGISWLIPLFFLKESLCDKHLSVGLPKFLFSPLPLERGGGEEARPGSLRRKSRISCFPPDQRSHHRFFPGPLPPQSIKNEGAWWRRPLFLPPPPLFCCFKASKRGKSWLLLPFSRRTHDAWRRGDLSVVVGLSFLLSLPPFFPPPPPRLPVVQEKQCLPLYGYPPSQGPFLSHGSTYLAAVAHPSLRFPPLSFLERSRWKGHKRSIVSARRSGFFFS